MMIETGDRLVFISGRAGLWWGLCKLRQCDSIWNAKSCIYCINSIKLK